MDKFYFSSKILSQYIIAFRQLSENFININCKMSFRKSYMQDACIAIIVQHIILITFDGIYLMDHHGIFSCNI